MRLILKLHESNSILRNYSLIVIHFVTRFSRDRFAAVENHVLDPGMEYYWPAGRIRGFDFAENRRSA